MISFLEARKIILNRTASFGQEIVDLDDSLGRVLAQNVLAPGDFPPFNRSAMDGIALKFSDIENGIKEFRVKETIFAGVANSLALAPGECYKIMTGAAVPIGADLVVRFEDLQCYSGGFRLLKNDFKTNQNIALRGQDLKGGGLAIEKGCLINSATIGMLASLGGAHVLVERLPIVNIITTGDEVVGLDKQPSPFQIFNSNAYTIKALLRENLIRPEKVIHVEDDKILLKSAIETHLNADILILTGGVSAGDADYVPEVMADLAVATLFHKVAIKPGKPIWCGKLNNTMIFALPGNPFSAMVTFKLFVEPYLKKSMGIKSYENSKLPISFDRGKASALDEFFPAISDGVCLNEVKINGSGDIRLGSQANALVMHESKIQQLKKGSKVGFWVW